MISLAIWGKMWRALIYEFLNYIKHNSLEQQIKLLKEACVLSFQNHQGPFSGNNFASSPAKSNPPQPGAATTIRPSGPIKK
jgi:hypothetical protein